MVRTREDRSLHDPSSCKPSLVSGPSQRRPVTRVSVRGRKWTSSSARTSQETSFEDRRLSTAQWNPTRSSYDKYCNPLARPCSYYIL